MLGAVLAIFAVMAIGALARRINWLTDEADQSLIHVVVRILFPALILKVILESSVLSNPRNLVLPPLLGFVTIAVGLYIALITARMRGRRSDLANPAARRTFAFCVGIYNYSYIPLPLAAQLFGHETVAVLFVYNVGVELAFWTIGIIVLGGHMGRKWYKQLINAPSVAILAALALKFGGAAPWLPHFLMAALDMMGAAAIPLSLLLVGATIADEYAHAQITRGASVMMLACILRLGILPALFLCMLLIPASIQLKQVIILQAAMPAAVFPVIVARHYGGHSATAIRVVLSTALVSLLTMPLWLSAGLHLLRLLSR